MTRDLGRRGRPDSESVYVWVWGMDECVGVGVNVCNNVCLYMYMYVYMYTLIHILLCFGALRGCSLETIFELLVLQWNGCM